MLPHTPLIAQRTAILATMHGKERVIAPILEQGLGVQVVVPPTFNTDLFGTFTGEVARAGTQLEAARLKAQRALEVTGEQLAIASEGSFMPHPNCAFIASTQELVLLLDTRQDLELVGTVFSTETNHNHQVVRSFREAQDFAQRSGFPEHGLIVAADSSRKHMVFKGIVSESALKEAVEVVLGQYPTAFLQTDMRAMYNPTRMKVIAQATRDLVEQVRSCCPQCGCPGFAITERRKGLPCQWCLAPSELPLAVVYQCQKCRYQREQLFPNGQKFADPGQCLFCNP